MKNEILAEIMLKVGSFPSLPKTHGRLMALVNDPETPIDEIEKTLRNDPGLTVNFLKLANSTYFGIPSKVSSVKQAIVLLGTRRIKQIGLATAASSIMNEVVPGYGMQAGELWKHSVMVSATAEGMAKKFKISDPHDIFTAALLHDLGKMVMGRYVEKEFNAINEIVSTGASFVIAENMVFGTDHAEIGSQILSNWSFPMDVVDAVRWHHDPDMIHNKNIKIDLLHLANIFCQNPSDETITLSTKGFVSPALIRRLNFSDDNFDTFSRNVVKAVNQFSAKKAFPFDADL